MNVVLKEMAIQNFKGIANETIKFNGKETKILAGNAKGKSTKMDAYFWCIDGKNQFFRDMGEEPKPKDDKGQVIHNLKTKVKVKLEVSFFDDNGKDIAGTDEVVFTKILTEKWTKNGDSFKNVFTYEVGGVDVGLKAFKTAVDAVFGDLERFRILSSATYLNEFMSMENKRKYFLGLVNDNSMAELLLSEKYISLADKISEFGIDTLEADLKKKKTKADKELKENQGALKFAKKDISIVLEPKEMLKKKDDIVSVINSLKDEGRKVIDSHNAKILQAQKTLRDSETKSMQVKNVNKWQIEQSVIKGERELQDFNELIKALKASLVEAEKTEAVKDKKIADIIKMNDVNILVFKKLKEIPKIGTNEVLTELKNTSYFFKEAVQKLRESSSEVENIKNRITKGYEKIESKNNELLKIKSDFDSINSEIEMLQDLVNSNRADLESVKKTEIKDFSKEIEDLEKELSIINTSVNDYEKYLEKQEEIKRLEEDIRLKSQFLMNLERDIQLLKELKVESVEMAEKPINEILGGNLKVKLFNEQLNGVLKPCFDMLVKNDKGIFVPYAETNTGAKANAGLQIIDTISKKKELNFPVWVDNAESVEKVQNIDSQIILLEVKK